MIDHISPDNITSLAPTEVFVYGANEAFRHGAGAARAALRFGAVHGSGPFVRQTYGICTKDREIQTLDLRSIYTYISLFEVFACMTPNLTYLVTEIGCGLAGYQPKDIAPLFSPLSHLPANIKLPRRFREVLGA